MDDFLSSKFARFFLLPSVWFVSSLSFWKRNADLIPRRVRRYIHMKYSYPNAVRRRVRTSSCSLIILNQRKSPSATRVSKEIETEFRSSFSLKSRKFLRGVMSSFDSRGWTQAIKHMAPVPMLGAPPPATSGDSPPLTRLSVYNFCHFLPCYWYRKV